jgi:hypothetical protein
VTQCISASDVHITLNRLPRLCIASIHSFKDTSYGSLECAIALGTKRTARRSVILSWERWLSPDEISPLLEAREKLAENEILYKNLQTTTAHCDLVMSRLNLERTTIRLMKIAVENELDSNRGFAEDHSSAWKVFDSLKEAPSGVPIPPDTLVNHFESVMAPKNSPHAAIIPPFLPMAGPLSADNISFDAPLSNNELEAAVAKINMSSAPGLDGITPRLAKDLFNYQPFFVFFLIFVNYCFVAGWVPIAWRISEIFILYKGKGDPTSADSYPRIALCSILAKVYERMLLNRLSRWWHSTFRSVGSQFGFRLGSSTLDAVFVMRNLINVVCKKHRIPLHAAFIDLRKAFPSVARGQMFVRLRDIGVPTPLILAIRSFYTLNISRLRIGSLLSRPFLVSLGLLEGSILSPLLFVIIFSFVWDFVQPSAFPSPGDTSRPKLTSIWILAFADDLVILSPSREKLEEVLKKLDEEMAKFNLQMSLQKTETMMFRHHMPYSAAPVPVVIRSCTLKETNSFKYLGVQVSEAGSLVDHSSISAQRARVSALLTVDILRKLHINDITRVKAYFLCFVQAEFYALEFLPLSVLPLLEQTCNIFMRGLFQLPRGTPSELFYVLFPCYSPAVLCLKRRLAFFQRILKHSLSCVTSSALVDVVDLYPMSCGWMHESFLFYKTVSPRVNHSNFDFLSELTSFMEIVATEEAFSFEFVHASPSVCMSLFKLVPTSHGFRSFRKSLSQLEHSFQHIVFVFSSSQVRWCFFSSPSQLCPLCHTKSWHWDHFLSCPLIVPLLTSRRISLLSFRAAVRSSCWPHVFDTIANVLLCWHFGLASTPCHRVPQYNPDVFRSLSRAAQALPDFDR